MRCFSNIITNHSKNNGKKEKVFIFPNNPRRDFVHIDDVVSANIFAFENYKNLDKKYYEVSTGVANFFEYLLERFRIKYEYLPETINKLLDEYQILDPSGYVKINFNLKKCCMVLR
jgi:nucleoside-diphosphate-sugar epimerase